MEVRASDKFAMYLRKSRADVELEQFGQGETLARHREMLHALADRHGIASTQIDTYQEVVSGESIDTRPEMQKLLSAVWARTYKGVLVVEVERLARGNTKDQGEVANAFQYSNTLIITPAKIYDPQNEFDQEYFEFGLFMSRREYKTIRRRLEAGKLASVKEGNYIGSKPPFGYDVIRTGKHDRTLVINEEQAKLVRQIFNWFTIDRLPAGTISHKLTLSGIPTPTGGAEWGRSTVQRILKNRQYTGVISWNEYPTSREYVDGEVRKSRRKNADIMLIEGKHPAIVSKEQYEFAQTLWDGTVPVKAETEIKNPLAGLLYCARCGYAMKRMSPSDKTVECFHHFHIKTCEQKSIHADTLIASLVDSLQKEIIDCELILSQNATESRRNDLADEIRKNIAKEQKKRERLYDAYESEIYTKDEFVSRRQKADEKIATLTEQLQEAESVPITDYRVRSASLHHAIKLLNDPDVPAKSKNDFLKSFIKRIDFDRKNGAVELTVKYL